MGKDTMETSDKYSLRGKVYDRIREDILNGVQDPELNINRLIEQAEKTML